MADSKLSDFSSASVDSDTQLIGLKTITGTSTDYRFAIADLLAYIGTTTGSVQVVGYGRNAAQTAAVLSIASYTVGASDETLEVSANVLVTASSNHGFTVRFTYTDEGNTVRNQTLNMQLISGSIVPSVANADGAVPHNGVPAHIRCKAGSTVTISTTGTFTSVTYNVEGVIKKLQ